MNALDSQLQEREELNLAALISDLAGRTGLTIATAECLTNGRIASRLGNARHARSWFIGGIVADSIQVKRQVLQVRASAIVSEQAAREMAVGTRTLFGADLCIAVTGGRDAGLDRAPGTVCFAIADRDGVLAETKHLPAAAHDSAGCATEHALTMVRRRLTAHWQRYRSAS